MQEKKIRQDQALKFLKGVLGVKPSKQSARAIDLTTVGPLPLSAETPIDKNQPEFWADAPWHLRAAEAVDRLRAAHRAYDEHLARADAAAVAADPRAVQRAKDEAQAVFQSAKSAARTPAEAETAAAAWLTEINRINSTTRSAATQLLRSREAVTALVVEIERLETKADAARIGAETAAEACLQAREMLARCEEDEEAQRQQDERVFPRAEAHEEPLVTGRVLAEVDLPAEAPLDIDAGLVRAADALAGADLDRMTGPELVAKLRAHVVHDFFPTPPRPSSTPCAPTARSRSSGAGGAGCAMAPRVSTRCST